MTTERVTTFKIFVGNIPDGATSEDIRGIFEDFGTVVECDCLGAKAFVHMEDDIEGQHALEQLQGHELNGNTLKIVESVKGRGELPKLPTVKLLVKNVNEEIDARGLRNLFKRFGFVVEVVLDNGEGHVRMEATGDIGLAIKEMNGYVVNEQALSVEPAPDPAEAGPSPKSNSKASQRGKGFGRGNPTPWTNAYNANDYQDYQDYEYHNYSEPSPWEMNMPHSFQPQPERILRDPHARPRMPNMNPRFPRPPSFSGSVPRFMGGRGRGGPNPRMFPPRPPMGFGMTPRGPPPPPVRIPRNARGRGQLHNHHQSNPFEDVAYLQQQQQQEVPFYEDEPIVAIPRDRPNMKMSLSGANCAPIGGEGGESYQQRPAWHGKRGRGKMWNNPRPPKFTAVTHDVAPGEKYPVPPMNNPSFRAPMKWSKEDVKRKIKYKKKPLVPAELPDYSMPVPNLPKPTIPQGAVLKPFPPPSSSLQHNQNTRHMDFTSDDY